MKKIIVSLMLLLAGRVLADGPVVQTTPYTQSFLQSQNAAAAQTALNLAGVTSLTVVSNTAIAAMVPAMATVLTNHYCIIFTNNFFWYAGQTYGPFADQTLTVSNAWNLFPLSVNAGFNSPPAGDHTYFMPGFHDLGRFTLSWPRQGCFGPSSMTLEGPGMVACILRETNTAGITMFNLATATNFNGTVVNAHDLGFAMQYDIANSNLINLGAVGNTTAGGLANGDWENCWFFCYNLLTNHWPTLTPDTDGGSPNAGVVGLNLQNSYGDKVKISHCHFNFIMGIWLQNDHIIFTDNVVESDGGANRVTGLSSPFANGNTVIFQTDSFNNHDQWIISGNEFVAANAYVFLDSTPQGHDIICDDYENAGSTAGIILTCGTPVTLIDPLGGSPTFQNLYDVPSTSNFRILQQDNLTSNLIQIANFNGGLGLYRMTATNPANVFYGNYQNPLIVTGAVANMLTIDGPGSQPLEQVIPNSGGDNVSLGYDAGLRLTSLSINNVFAGYEAGIATGTYNGDVGIGAFSMWNYFGNSSVSVGANAMFNGTGNQNVGVGYNALAGLAQSTEGTCTAVGYQAGYNTTNGATDIYLGYLAGFNVQTANNNIEIGSQGVFGDAQTTRIGTPGTQTNCVIAGSVSTASGFASGATNIVHWSTSGVTNTTPVNMRVISFSATSSGLVFTNFNTHTGFSWPSTLSGQFIVLQPNEALISAAGNFTCVTNIAF